MSFRDTRLINSAGRDSRIDKSGNRAAFLRGLKFPQRCKTRPLRPAYVTVTKHWRGKKIATCSRNERWTSPRLFYDIDWPLLVVRSPSLSLHRRPTNTRENVTRLRNERVTRPRGHGKMHNQRNSKVQLISFTAARLDDFCSAAPPFVCECGVCVCVDAYSTRTGTHTFLRVACATI